jgi:hypothetical protein
VAGGRIKLHREELRDLDSSPSIFRIEWRMLRCHVRWVPLSPQHGASSGWGWKEGPPALEVSCEYIE